MPGRPTNLDNSRARAYFCLQLVQMGRFGHFFARLYFLFSFSLSKRRFDTDLNTVQNNQPTISPSMCPQQVCRVSERSIENCKCSCLHKLHILQCRKCLQRLSSIGSSSGIKDPHAHLHYVTSMHGFKKIH